jgi:hypothetical protein
VNTNLSKILELLSSYMTQATVVIQHYAPAVWKSTLWLIQFVAIYHLIIGGLLLLGSIVSVYFLIRSFKACDFDNDFPAAFLLSVVCCLICGGGIFHYLFSVSNWLGAFQPQLAVLYKIARSAHLLN